MTNTTTSDQALYPFNLRHYADAAPNVWTQGDPHFLCRFHKRWLQRPSILVRFCVGMTHDSIAVHYTALAEDEQYQPWSAWDGCAISGNSRDHSRKIWHMVRKTGYVPIGMPWLMEYAGMTTKYSGSSHSRSPIITKKNYEYISEYALKA